MKKGTIKKRITEAYTFGKIVAKAEAILEKYGVKSSVILEKFTNEEAYNEIISCFAHLKKRVPFKKCLTNEEKSAFVSGYIDAKQISNP